MIPVPTPRRGSAPALPATTPLPPAGPGSGPGPLGRPGRPRRPGRVIALVLAGVAALLLAVGAIVVFVLHIDPVLVGLAALVLVLGGTSFGARLLPPIIPGIRLLRSLIGLAATAALAAGLYFYVIPLAQHGVSSLTGGQPYSNAGPHAAGPVTKPAPATATIVYEVTGTAPSAVITEFPSLDSTSGPNPSGPQPIPYSRTITTSALSQPIFLSATVSPQLTGAATDPSDPAETLSCRITVDGTVIDQQRASGPYALVHCSAQPPLP
ncbi:MULTISPECIES: hypothetical protein [Subtercola]|uniref:MmpS family membrane protein n=1 Tax=Subtercola vilae TaxID=2056433 RepID=A0A4T2BJB4_9MICO|nr:MULTISPECIES: hypothetical protein [Subtercola]MEA9986603.1 hypothetical protein [Subtercola sp. RTI3]TIH31643.1 hypothetical protein D4765_16285 [Subtercola vilae]